MGKLASRFRVSKEVILRRLLILGRTTSDSYEGTREQFLEQYRKRKLSESSGGPAYYRLVLRDTVKRKMKTTTETQNIQRIAELKKGG